MFLSLCPFSWLSLRLTPPVPHRHSWVSYLVLLGFQTQWEMFYIKTSCFHWSKDSKPRPIWESFRMSRLNATGKEWLLIHLAGRKATFPRGTCGLKALLKIYKTRYMQRWQYIKTIAFRCHPIKQSQMKNLGLTTQPVTHFHIPVWVLWDELFSCLMKERLFIIIKHKEHQLHFFKNPYFGQHENVL